MTPDEKIREAVRNTTAQLDGDRIVFTLATLAVEPYNACSEDYVWEAQTCGLGESDKGDFWIEFDTLNIAGYYMDEANAIRAAFEAMPPDEWEWRAGKLGPNTYSIYSVHGYELTMAAGAVIDRLPGTRKAFARHAECVYRHGLQMAYAKRGEG